MRRGDILRTPQGCGEVLGAGREGNEFHVAVANMPILMHIGLEAVVAEAPGPMQLWSMTEIVPALAWYPRADGSFVVL